MDDTLVTYIDDYLNHKYEGFSLLVTPFPFIQPKGPLVTLDQMETEASLLVQRFDQYGMETFRTPHRAMPPSR